MESRTFHWFPQVSLCHIVTSLVFLYNIHTLTRTPTYLFRCQGTPQQWLTTGAQKVGGCRWMAGRIWRACGSTRTRESAVLDWCPLSPSKCLGMSAMSSHPQFVVPFEDLSTPPICIQHRTAVSLNCFSIKVYCWIDYQKCTKMTDWGKQATDITITWISELRYPG